MKVLKMASGLLNIIYPVGSIYMSVNSTNPSTLFGGTWVQIKGRFLLACGPDGNGWNEVAGNTGGESSHTLTIDELPPHQHRIYTPNSGTLSRFVITANWANSSVEETASRNACMGNAGYNCPHNNMPPYLAVYMWKRTA